MCLSGLERIEKKEKKMLRVVSGLRFSSFLRRF
jgi:hypothetical protein